MAARVTSVHTEKDDVIRVVSLKLPGGGTTKRAINEVCVLPIDT